MNKEINTSIEISRSDRATIISQNLYNYRKKNAKGINQVEFYMRNYKADVYSFQEFPKWGRGKTFYTTFYTNFNDEKEENRGSVNEAEKIWKKYFPWSDFPNGYWSEVEITFNGVKIRLINVHISTRYTDQLRLVLLKRLEQLGEMAVILLGDFNAAFPYQTEVNIDGNHIFLNNILGNGYREILGENESEENPHFTYALQPSKGKLWERKKLDHIFVSPELGKHGWNMIVEYIDDVNINLSQIYKEKTPADPFTDHSGLKLVIESKICW